MYINILAHAWLPGCLAAWLPGCLAAWLPGCQVRRLAGPWAARLLASFCFAAARLRQRAPLRGRDPSYDEATIGLAHSPV